MAVEQLDYVFECFGRSDWLDHASEIPLLYADPHERGPGKVHAYDPGKPISGTWGVGRWLAGKTRCGRTLQTCPGKLEVGAWSDVNCMACVRGFEADEARAEAEGGAPAAGRRRAARARLVGVVRRVPA